MAAEILAASALGETAGATAGGAAGGSMNIAGLSDIAGGVVQAGGQQSGGIPGLLGSMGDPLATGWNLLGDIMTWVQNKKTREEQKRQFDATFAENQRQFGLNYALKEFATRKQIDMQEARDMWNEALQSGQLALQTASTRSALETAAQQRAQEETKFDWMTESRDKQIAASKAYATGVLQGLSGRTT